MSKPEPRKRKPKPYTVAAYTLLLVGSAALASSIIYTSSILAFIGLGLTFWGALLLFISPTHYVKSNLLSSTVTPLLATIDQLISNSNSKEKGIYLPPKYLKNPETSKVYIPKNKNTNLPTPQEIQQQEHKTFLKNPEATLITPPGLSLSKLFEKTLGTSFTEVDIEYLQQNLPKLFIEDLEIAENLEIQIKPSKVAKKINNSVSLIQAKNDTIHVKITNSIYKDTCKQAEKLSHICTTIGCPLCSAIACALAKATHKPIIIEKNNISQDGKTIETQYRIIEE